MHETSESFSSRVDSQGVASDGRLDTRCVDRDSHCRATAAFVGVEIDGGQSAFRFESTGGGGLDSQSQWSRTSKHLRCAPIWSSSTVGSGGSEQAGEGAGKVSRGFRSATKPLGWDGGGGVLAQRVQRQTPAAPVTQLVEAIGLCLEATELSLPSSQQQGSCSVSARAQKKLQRIVKQKEKALLIFADESGFSIHPKLGRVWAKRGSHPTVPTTSQHHKRLNLFGWVEPLKGWHGLFPWPKGNTDGFLAFLKYLCHRVRKTKVYLYIDGASWHKGDRVRQFLIAHPNIEVEYLPPYHPELNVQERVWHLIRYEVTTNQYHATIDLIEQAIRKRQRHWKTGKIKSLCTVT